MYLHKGRIIYYIKLFYTAIQIEPNVFTHYKLHVIVSEFLTEEINDYQNPSNPFY